MIPTGLAIWEKLEKLRLWRLTALLEVFLCLWQSQTLKVYLLNTNCKMKTGHTFTMNPRTFNKSLAASFGS